MSKNQLVQYGEFQYGDLTQTDIQVIHETIAKDCSEPQFRLFMTIAKSLGANPILNEIYPTVIQGKLTPQFGIGFYVSQARKHSDYKGYDVQLVHENDEFKMHQERAEDGRYYVVIDEHSWSFPRGKVTGCYAFAYREGFKPFSVIMGFEEVEHYQRSGIGMQKTMWTNNLADMFKKHTAKRALNAAFGLSLDEDSSVEGQGTPDNFEPSRKDITPDVTPTETPKATSKSAQKIAEPIDVTPDPAAEEAKFIAAQEAIADRFKQLGITKGKAAWITENCNVFDVQNMTLEEYEQAITFMDMKIAEKEAADDELL